MKSADKMMTPSADEYDKFKEVIRTELAENLAEAPLAKQMKWRLGHRGAFLAVMGLLYMFLGYGYGFTELPSTTVDQLVVPRMIIPDMTVWGVFWMVGGSISIVNAWWPPGADKIGFVVLEGAAASWGLLSLSSAMIFGAPRAMTVSAIFVVFAISILIVSGMPDPSPAVKAAVDDDDNDDSIL